MISLFVMPHLIVLELLVAGHEIHVRSHSKSPPFDLTSAAFATSAPLARAAPIVATRNFFLVFTFMTSFPPSCLRYGLGFSPVGALALARQPRDHKTMERLSNNSLRINNDQS